MTGAITALLLVIALLIFLMYCTATAASLAFIRFTFKPLKKADLLPEFELPAGTKDQAVIFEYEMTQYLQDCSMFYHVVPIRKMINPAGKINVQEEPKFTRASDLIAFNLKRNKDGSLPEEIEKAVRRHKLDKALIGFELFRNTGSDHGADILLNYKTKKIVVQCKHSSGDNVSPNEVADAYMGKRFYDADYSILVTNTKFSREAITTAELFDIYLFDEEQVSALKKASMSNRVYRQSLDAQMHTSIEDSENLKAKAKKDREDCDALIKQILPSSISVFAKPRNVVRSYFWHRKKQVIAKRSRAQKSVQADSE